MCSVSTGHLLSKAGTECREEFLYILKAGLRAASGRPPARQRHSGRERRPHPHNRWSQSRHERALVPYCWTLQAGRARRKKEATCDLDHHSPADPRRLRRGWSQDRGPYVARQAGGAIARPAMEGHGWRIAFQARDPGPHWGHIRATTTGSQRTTVTIGRASTQLSRHTPPPAAGRRGLSQLSDTEGVTGSNPVAPTRHNVSRDPPLSAACQQIVSRSLVVTARTL
jgi:hypothetical protein